MISKDQSITTQVAAKIAADLVSKNQPLDNVLADWSAAFLAVRDQLFEAHAISAVAEAFPGTEITATVVAPAPAPAPVAAPTATGAEWTVEVVNGAQGPLPTWLTAACRKAGVRRVFDNRDQLSANPSRPWFRQADAQEGQKVQAFWPPKGVAA